VRLQARELGAVDGRARRKVLTLERREVEIEAARILVMSIALAYA
jgi:hypothetical protein